MMISSLAFAAPNSREESSAPINEHTQYWVRTIQTHPMQLVRKNAARVLGTLGDLEVVPVLMGALKDSFFGVRAEAARSLGNMGDDRAVPVLRDLSQRDSDAQVRKNARDAVEKIHATIEFRKKKQEKLNKKTSS